MIAKAFKSVSFMNEFIEEMSNRFKQALEEEAKAKQNINEPVAIYKIEQRGKESKIGLYFDKALSARGYEPYVLDEITSNGISIAITDISFRDEAEAERYLRAEAKRERYYFGKEYKT